MSVWKILNKEFEERDSIPFDEYLNIVLYHPIHGYYSKGGGIGKEGDFYTSPHLHPIFGWTIGKFLYRYWEYGNIFKELRILEVGAGYGYLAYDILTELMRYNLEVHYLIVEKSLKLREFQKKLLKDRPVTWLEDLPSSICNSIVLSNELIDAFPFKRFLFDGESWREFYVKLRPPNTLYFTTKAIPDEKIIDLLKRYEDYVKPGQVVEFSVESLSYLERIFSGLKDSLVITIDYGERRKDLINKFPNGSMTVYKDHRVYTDPFLDPGRTDITYHVDFDLIVEEGLKWGINPLYFKDQGAFLVDIGILSVLKGMEERIKSQEEIIKMRLAVKTLIYSFGKGHRVLIQGCGKGIEMWERMISMGGI